MNAFEATKYDLNYEMIKAHNDLLMRVVTNYLGHQPTEEDLDRIEIASKTGSLTDHIKIDGHYVGKIEHVNDHEGYRIRFSTIGDCNE